jgi:hypothetical protein
MCALGSGSTHYPPTLLEIAKLTVRRPLAGMGILGILEPRGSLRRRIERLIDFRPPARAGWGLGSTIVILAFGAVALPMGQKQKAGEDLDVPAANPEFRSLAEASSPAVLSATSNGVHLEFGRNRLSADQVTLAVSNRQPILTASGHVVAEQNQVPETLGSGGKFTTFGYDIATVVAPPAAGQKETLESANQQKAAAAVQILINARFVLAPLELSDSLWTLVGRTNQAGRDEATGDFWALLTPAQAAVLRRRVESTSESQLIISAASVVSLSGRQTEIQITDLKNIVTNLNPQALIPPGISSTNELYQSGNMALGPILDSVASVLADGFHIQVEARANVSEFIGYDDPQRKVQAYVDGKRTSVVQPLPHFREGKAVASAAVPDGHTLLLGTTMHDNFGAAVVTSKAKNDHLLVLLTITLIDSAGNRLHPDQ